MRRSFHLFDPVFTEQQGDDTEYPAGQKTVFKIGGILTDIPQSDQRPFRIWRDNFLKLFLVAVSFKPFGCRGVLPVGSHQLTAFPEKEKFGHAEFLCSHDLKLQHNRNRTLRPAETQAWAARQSDIDQTPAYPR
ncbi:hypothetical protein ACX3P5_08015 [Pantoea sp. S-LA4]